VALSWGVPLTDPLWRLPLEAGSTVLASSFTPSSFSSSSSSVPSRRTGRVVLGWVGEVVEEGKGRDMGLSTSRAAASSSSVASRASTALVRFQCPCDEREDDAGSAASPPTTAEESTLPTTVADFFSAAPIRASWCTWR